MILSSEYFESSFEIREKCLNTLVIENKKYYRKIIKDMRDTVALESRVFIVYENEEEVNLSKNAELVTNVFDLDPNSNKILNKIYGQISQEVLGEELYTYNLDFRNSLSRLLEEIAMKIPYDFKYKDLDFKYILKAVDLEIDTKIEGLMSNIIEYMEITYKLLNKKIFFLVGIDNYFDEKELYDLNEYLCYNNIIVVCLQNSLERGLLPNENLRIIDKDLVEI